MSEPVGVYVFQEHFVHTVHDDGLVVRVNTRSGETGVYYIRLGNSGKIEFRWTSVEPWQLFENDDKEYIMQISEIYTSYLVETGLNLWR